MTVSDDPTVDHDSWDLVQAAQRGTSGAFAALYARYYSSIYHYVLIRTGSASLAEDFSSETFLRAWNRIGSIRYRGKSIRAWFMTVARNVVIDYYKSSRARREIIRDEIVAEGQFGDSAENDAMIRMRNRDILLATTQLTVAQQQCIHLRFYRELSVSAVSEVMKIHSAAVRALQHRALRRLAQILAEEPTEHAVIGAPEFRQTQHRGPQGVVPLS